jgi:16S rRNA (cytosine967-C5)-methyltransferase
VGDLSARDRHLAHELSAGVLRSRRALDATLDMTKVDARLRDILRLGVYQLRRLDRIPDHAAVSTSVELARATAGEAAARYVNQALRKVAVWAGSGERGAVASHPEWLVARWRERFGADATAQLIEWNDRRPRMVLQPTSIDTGTLRRRLEGAGYQVEAAAFGAGLSVSRIPTAPRSPLPVSLPGYPEGEFIVQDPAQVLVCRFAAVPSGARLYDACAAPGGKTVTLALGGVRVTAGDRRPQRLGRLVDTLRRARVEAPIVAADLLAAPWPAASWDAVLVDAPCSATGTMARHPDARWRVTPQAIDRLAERQSRLLDAAAILVRPGGLVVYATCSLEAEENENQVDAFLHRHREFTRAPVPGAVPAELITAAGDFRSQPWRHGVDGAYAARLERARGSA